MTLYLSKLMKQSAITESLLQDLKLSLEPPEISINNLNSGDDFILSSVISYTDNIILKFNQMKKAMKSNFEFADFIARHINSFQISQVPIRIKLKGHTLTQEEAYLLTQKVILATNKTSLATIKMLKIKKSNLELSKNCTDISIYLDYHNIFKY